MLMVDLHSTSARITLEEILTAGTPLVSNPVAFATFMRGLRLSRRSLLTSAGRRPETPPRISASSGYSCMTFPRFYGVRHLESIGGRFSLRLTRIADFTVVAINRRVVTLQGPPQDDTGAAIIHAEMSGTVFMAICNELLARATETALLALDLKENARCGVCRLRY